MDSLCHPRLWTTKPSYRFPIFETSAAALCSSTCILLMHELGPLADASEVLMLDFVAGVVLPASFCWQSYISSVECWCYASPKLSRMLVTHLSFLEAFFFEHSTRCCGYLNQRRGTAKQSHPGCSCAAPGACPGPDKSRLPWTRKKSAVMLHRPCISVYLATWLPSATFLKDWSLIIFGVPFWVLNRKVW